MTQATQLPTELRQELSRGLPTATAAVMETQDEWAELGFGGARLVALHTGRAD